MRPLARASAAALAVFALVTCDEAPHPTGAAHPSARGSAAVAPAAQAGAWSAPGAMPVVAAHMSVLPDTRVLFWVSSDMPGDTERHHVYQWNPADGSYAEIVTGTHNVFCSSHTFTADGLLLVSGGHIADNKGLKDVKLFNWTNNAWENAASMNKGRWYPTSAILGNAEVAVVAGSDENASGNFFPEIYNPTTRTWRQLRGAPLNLPYYPWLYAAPDGRAFLAGPTPDARYLNPSGDGEWSGPVYSAAPVRDWGSSAMYMPGKILITGGGANAPTATAEVIDLNDGASAAWRRTGDMRRPRKHLTTVVLPDGRVLAVGGTAGAGFNSEAGAVYTAEVWDPATGAWTELAAMARHRLYHSSAVLLADGRVLVAGGGRCGGCTVNNLDYEVFSPPYLFNADGSPAARPTVTAAPASVAHGQQFVVNTPDAAGISRVAIVRLPATTHSFNQNQWYDTLSFTRTAGALTVRAPATARRAPPGHYLLFVLNAAGVPSVARVLRLDGTVAPYPAPGVPSAPSGLRVTALDNTQARLIWSDSSANETDFAVERCAGAGCTSFAEIARLPANTTTRLDNNLTPGAVYSYRVRALNGSGQSAYTAAQAVTMPTGAQTRGEAIVARAGGKCVNVANDNQSLGTPVVTTACTALGAATWIIPTTGASGDVRNYADRCLDAAGAAGNDGDPLIIWECNGQPNQQWSYTAAGELRGIGGKCVRLQGNGSVDGTGLAIGACTPPTPGQQFDVGLRSADTPPVAAFTASCTGRQCEFNSAESSDDHGIVSRTWDYGDGTGAGDAINVFKSYPAVGVERSYVVRLVVTDEAGQPAQATRTVVVPPTLAAPDAPTDLRAVAVGGTQVQLAWADNSSNETEFQVERCQGAGCATFALQARAPAGAAAYIDNGLAPGTAYSYRVRAANDLGASQYTTVASVTTPSGPQAAGEAVTTRAGAKCLSVLNNTVALGAAVVTAPCTALGAQSWVVPPTGTAGAVGNYADKCLDAAGGGGNDGDPLIIWECNGGANQRWTYTVAGDLRGVNGKCARPLGSTAADGTRFALGACTGAADQLFNVGSRGGSAPAAPSGLRAVALGNTQAQLDWVDNSNNETQFEVERCQGANCTAFALVATSDAGLATTFDPGLTPGVTYGYRVRARNAAGASAYAAAAYVTMPSGQSLGEAVVPRGTTKCLAVLNNNPAAGAAIVTAPCTAAGAQAWLVAATGAAGPIRNYTDKCLDAAGGTGRDGDPMIVWWCHGQPNQQWTYTAAGELRGVNGKCVRLLGSGAVDGTRLAIGPCTGAADQRFDVGARSTAQSAVQPGRTAGQHGTLP